MSIFKKAVLTRAGKALITKNQANRGTTEFTKAVSGSGAWDLEEDLENADELKTPMQNFEFSGIDIPDGNPATVVLTVLLNNKGMEELYYISELGIFANDPDDGEVLYAIAVTDDATVYMPAENGIGISSIVERINIEVSNSSSVIIKTDAGLVSATDFLDLKKLVNRINNGLCSGTPGQAPYKKSSENYDIEWKDPKKDVITGKAETFPKEGEKNTLYVDPEDASMYIWKDGEYFKLPLGAEAAETLQKQISKNTESIKDLQNRTKTLEKRFDEIHIIALAEEWNNMAEEGTPIYIQEIEAKTAQDKGGTIWPEITSTEPDDIVKEQKAQAVFFANGRAFTENGKVVLLCYKKQPMASFGIIIQGGE